MEIYSLQSTSVHVWVSECVCARVSHGSGGILDELHPCVPLIFGAGMNLHHLGLLDSRRDEEQPALLIRHLPHDQILQRDHCAALILYHTRENITYALLSSSSSSLCVRACVCVHWTYQWGKNVFLVFFLQEHKYIRQQQSMHICVNAHTHKFIRWCTENYKTLIHNNKHFYSNML